MYGKALSACYELLRLYNPREDGYELKALFDLPLASAAPAGGQPLWRWLPRGGCAGRQFASDLAEVGNGLVGFFAATGGARGRDWLGAFSS